LWRVSAGWDGGKVPHSGGDGWIGPGLAQRWCAGVDLQVEKRRAQAAGYLAVLCAVRELSFLRGHISIVRQKGLIICKTQNAYLIVSSQQFSVFDEV
jgi:hypothetical protein